MEISLGGKGYNRIYTIALTFEQEQQQSSKNNVV